MVTKVRSIVISILSACVYIILVTAIFLLSASFTPWAIPGISDILLLGVGVSWQQLVQAIIGLPMFVYGALLVQRTTAINHTAQNRETREPEKLLTHDVYAVRRHPMYTGFICLQAGLWFGACSLLGYLIGAAVISVVSLNSKREETGELERLFPGEYEKYQRSVPHRILTPKLAACLLLILLLTVISTALIIL